MSTGNLQPATSYPVILGRVIEHFRSEAGFNQFRLSEAAGISQATISRIESGSVDATLSQLRKIASALRFTPEKLLKETEKAVRKVESKGILVKDRREDETEAIGAGTILIGAVALAALIFAATRK